MYRVMSPAHARAHLGRTRAMLSFGSAYPGNASSASIQTDDDEEPLKFEEFKVGAPALSIFVLDLIYAFRQFMLYISSL